MSFAKYLVLFLSLVVSASALVTPHAVRNVHHRAIAAHIVANPISHLVNPFEKRATRAGGKRCRQRPSSSSSLVGVPSVAPATNSAPLPSSSLFKPAPTTVTTQRSPSPTPRPSPTTTTTEAAAPTTNKSNSNLPSFMVGTQTGQGTFYATGLGACGITNKDTDFIAAASHLLFDNFPGYNGVNPNSNPICGRTVTAHYQGKSVIVALTDRCVGCAETDLDFSPSAFAQIADFAVGRISGMTWTWN